MTSVRVNEAVRVARGSDGGIVVTTAWCDRCKQHVSPDGERCPWCDSRIVDESQLSAKQMLAQLREPSATERILQENEQRRNGHAAVEGRDLLDAMDAGQPLPPAAPDKAARPEEPGPAEPAPHQEEPHRYAGDAPAGGAGKWTRETAIAAIRDVGGELGRTPTQDEMRVRGHGGLLSPHTRGRIGPWRDLVAAAGFKPRIRGVHVSKARAARKPEPTQPDDGFLDHTKDAYASALIAALRAFADTLETELALR